MPVFTHPLSRTAGDLFDQAAIKLGAPAASRWMMSGNDALGGDSPIQAIKNTGEDKVKRLILAMEDRRCGSRV